MNKMHWIRAQIRALSAYRVPDAKQGIKLDAMENPYPWDAELINEWLQVLRNVSLNRYPDPEARETTALLRQRMGVPENMSVILGNGSDELIQMLALTLSGSEHGTTHCLLTVEPSFVMYKMIATVVGMDYQSVDLNDGDFSLNLDNVLTAMEQHKPALVFLAYPNNPTANLFDRHAMETIISAAPGIVVIDEAYCAFTNDSFMPELERYDNLLIMRTVSKLGLAGLRLGMLVGASVWINEIAKTTYSPN